MAFDSSQSKVKFRWESKCQGDGETALRVKCWLQVCRTKFRAQQPHKTGKWCTSVTQVLNKGGDTPRYQWLVGQPVQQKWQAADSQLK